MKEREGRRELLVPLATVGLLVIASFGAFTKKQRDSIVFDRDEGKCQFPGHHNCKGGLQCHHIIPQRYAKEFDIDPDYAENGLTICEESHVGKNGIHPDIAKAKKSYFRKKKKGASSFNEAFEERQRKLDNKEIYWDDSHDRQMSTRAVQNTQKAKKRGWLFPLKRKKK